MKQRSIRSPVKTQGYVSHGNLNARDEAVQVDIDLSVLSQHGFSQTSSTDPRRTTGAYFCLYIYLDGKIDE